VHYGLMEFIYNLQQLINIGVVIGVTLREW